MFCTNKFIKMHLAKTIVHINCKDINKIFNYYYFLTKTIVHLNGKVLIKFLIIIINIIIIIIVIIICSQIEFYSNII